MGKRIIQQARGHGSLTYRVKKRAFRIKPSYPLNLEGEWIIKKFVRSAGHTAPIVEIVNSEGKKFYNLAANSVFEGQKIVFGGKNVGDICFLKDLDVGTKIFNIERIPFDGGKFVRSGGNSAVVVSKELEGIKVLMPSKIVRIFDEKCRATIGELAAQGRKEKPVLKAGKKYYIKKAKSKKWPRTSAVKMNAVDHPFGSGRGKRIKSKIVKRFASPGQKVGLLRPRRTGRKKL
ncbi:MAG: 50S ribosomal protein L2 [Candidatus Pacearchaeota archaeon]